MVSNREIAERIADARWLSTFEKRALVNDITSALTQACESARAGEREAVVALRETLRSITVQLNAEALKHEAMLAEIDADTEEGHARGDEYAAATAGRDAYNNAIVAIQNALSPPTEEIAF